MGCFMDADLAITGTQLLEQGLIGELLLLGGRIRTALRAWSGFVPATGVLSRH
jgi:hypothetical protein